MENKTLQVTVKQIYGNELVYPACEQSKLLCKLTNTKTFTEQSISIIKQLGFSFQVITTKEL